MGKKEKRQEKKAEKKAMKKKLNGSVVNVKLANSVDDPLSNLPKPFSVFNKNGLDLTLETVRAPEISEKTFEWAFDLVKTNMKPLYDDAYAKDPNMQTLFGWNEGEKRAKMRGDLSWYLIARTSEGTPVAFSHFRYFVDTYEDEVLYCHELQVEQAFRRKGLGKFMMKVLEMLMIKADMLKIMCTIFFKDTIEVDFFKTALKFEADDTNFIDTTHEQVESEILSRFNQIKKRKMEEEMANSENVLSKANSGCGCCH